MAGQGRNPAGGLDRTGDKAEFKTVWTRLRANRLARPIGVLMVGGVLSTRVPTASLFIWFSAFIASTILDFVIAERYVRKLMAEGRNREAVPLSCLTQILTASIVASVGIWAWNPGDNETNCLVMSVLFLLSASRVSVNLDGLIPHFVSSLPYFVMPILAPWIGGLKVAAEITVVTAIAASFLIGAMLQAKRSSETVKSLKRAAAQAEAERHVAQAALVQLKAESDAAQAAHRSLLTGLDEDARGPLGSILRVAEELLQEGATGTAGQHLKRCAAEIHGNCLQLMSYTRDIANLGQIESGTLPITLKRVDLDEALAAAADECAALLGDAQISLEIIIDPDLPDLLADERLVQRMAVNLVVNAMRESLPDGRVTITAMRLPDGGLGLRVSSTGSGLSEAELERALDTLISGKLGHSSTDLPGGLSLMIVRSLAERQGGSLSTRNRLGSGMQVTVHFPPERLVGGKSLVRFAKSA